MVRYTSQFRAGFIIELRLSAVEDNVMMSGLKNEGSFFKERHFGLSIISLCLGSVKEGALPNEVPVIWNVFCNQFAKSNGQYPEEDAKVPAWIRSSESKWWTMLIDFTLHIFKDRLIARALLCSTGLEVCD
ncbi:uncharacterized protein A4U43_C03F26650 [Asparagus officinalis]|uniref:Uncharacterized protein n=1 Tax=Asparagus officinalis TaxID=4686 RepID=A0A5P1FDA0_ASPOF|nr:uncharacterized protein A4U43_C03F26650 [Asparagus officinalis]